MAFILWRTDIDGTNDYVTAWADNGVAAFTKERTQALRYETRAAAEHAIGRRTPAGWQVEEIEAK